ncbi:hypothetical protein BH11MYX4_BH11MYX4_10270 [soil metagenome]
MQESNTSTGETTSSLKRLHNDKRGAIMLMGLCMSCFLIGSLWFLIGIGDAIVFRDTMQEATDHATFTSAALHAKGMNFISACNLFILALIAVHIIMGLIHDILLAICIISLGFGCGAWVSWRRVYTTYSKIFKPIAGGLHLAEVAASFGYPLLGAYKGYTTGNDYGGFGPKKHSVSMYVVSPSLIPGNAMVGPLNKVFTRKGKGPVGKDGKPTDSTTFTSDTRDAKKGLPVQAKKFSDVCDLVAKKGIDALLSLTGHGGGAAIDMVKGWIGGLIKVRYCNDMGSTTPDLTSRFNQGSDAIDSANTSNASKTPKGGTPPKPIDKPDAPGGGGSGSCMKDGSSIDPGLDKWWGCDGPLVPWSGTMNGSPWNEVWGVNWRPEFSDAQEHRVAVGQRKFGVTSTAETNIYFAEAEFYFDCNKEWTEVDCNKDDNAGYSVQWRARLKRLQFPEVGSLLTSFAGSFLTQLKGYKDLQNKIRDLTATRGPDGKIITVPGGGGNPLITGSFGGVVEALEKKFNKFVQGGARGAGEFMNPDLGAYH